MISVQLSDRVKNLPPYLFAAIDKMKQDALAKGIDLAPEFLLLWSQPEMHAPLLP